jgi:hypothetical protein
MWSKIAVVLTLACVGLATVIATRPSSFRILRSRRLTAPPELVYGYVNDLHRWTDWSPFEKVDPHLQRDYAGPPAGVGASYHWNGNEQIGEGRMTITDATPSRRVVVRLEFLRPFAATNTAELDLVPSGAGTHMTWTMSGTNTFMGKAIGLVMDMDEMVGGQFERGLATLDTVTATKGTSPGAAAGRS